MLLPRSHAWTARQRRLIVFAVVLAFASISALIYGYECYYRGPSESAFLGTWRFDDQYYVEFTSDHDFSIFERAGEPDTMIVKGRWYAGGKLLYLRFPPRFCADGRLLEVWHIDNISPEELRVRYRRDGMTHVFKRVDPFAAPTTDQAMSVVAATFYSRRQGRSEGVRDNY